MAPVPLAGLGVETVNHASKVCGDDETFCDRQPNSSSRCIVSANSLPQLTNSQTSAELGLGMAFSPAWELTACSRLRGNGLPSESTANSELTSPRLVGSMQTSRPEP